MDVSLHQRAERSIYEAMPFQRSLAREMTRDNSNLKMAPAVTRAGVARVAVTVVDDVELVGFERGLEPAAYRGDALGRHGHTRNTGLISTSANTPSST